MIKLNQKLALDTFRGTFKECVYFKHVISHDQFTHVERLRSFVTNVTAVMNYNPSTCHMHTWPHVVPEHFRDRLHVWKCQQNTKVGTCGSTNVDMKICQTICQWLYIKLVSAISCPALFALKTHHCKNGKGKRKHVTPRDWCRHPLEPTLTRHLAYSCKSDLPGLVIGMLKISECCVGRCITLPRYLKMASEMSGRHLWQIEGRTNKCRRTNSIFRVTLRCFWSVRSAFRTQ